MGDDPQHARGATLRRGSHGEPVAPGSAARSFVARSAEMTRFDELLARQHGVVLYGAAGSGKTRLAEVLVERAALAGHPTRFLRGRASIADLPLGPFAPLLPSAVERVDGVSLLVVARDSITALGGGRPLVLGVDDLHLLDPSSAMLLHQLVLSQTVVLVGTVREGEWIPEAVTELWRSSLVDRWHVDDLAPDAVIEMAESILGARVAPQIGDELVRLSAGNPLFVATLAHAVRESGVSVDQAMDLGEAAATSTLVDFVAARLHGLDPSARDALAVVALGEPIGLTPLERMTDERSLVVLERGGWLTIAESRRRTEVRLAHPLFGEVLRRSLSRLLARSVYRELAQATLGHGARRHDDLLRVAAWSLDGGTPLDAERLTAAAGEAAARGDFTLATRLAEVAWEAEEQFDSGLLLMFLHRSRTFLDHRVAFLARLHELATDPVQTAMIITTRSFESFWRNGDLAEAMALLDAGIAELGPGDASDELIAQRATYLATCGHVAEANDALARLTSSTSPRVRASAAYAERVLAASFGDPRTVLDDAEPGGGATPHATNQFGMLSVRVIQASLCRAMVHDAQILRAEESIRASVHDQLFSNRSAGTMENILGWVLAWRGRPREGYRWSQRAATLQAAEGYRTLENWSRAVMAFNAALAGDLEAHDAALAAHDALNPNPTVASRGVAWHAQAIAEAARGNRDGARMLAVRGVREMADHGLLFDEAVLLHVRAQLDEPHEVIARLDELAAALGGLPALLATHVHGLAERDAVALVELAERMHDAGLGGLAATVSADAGAIFEERGDGRSAARTARRTRELLAQLDVTEPFVERPRLEPLSRREREVAELAAGGMPSREIAERLFLSTHTVDNHLSSAYDKLGVRARSELARALLGDGSAG